MSCSLNTKLGTLIVELYAQMPKTSALLRDLINGGAYYGCTFDRITATHVHLSAPVSRFESVEPETHTMIKFGKRGIVALLSDLSMIITTSDKAPTIDCTIVGVLTPQSFWVLQEIASASAKDEVPLYPISIEGPEAKNNEPKVTKKEAKPSKPKRVIRMFDEVTAVPSRKFKRNPTIGKPEPQDIIYERLKTFERQLDETN